MTVTKAQKEELVAAACAVRIHAYAPYSNYRVGAAILLPDGRILTGVNVENASYGLTICAERTAVFRAVTEGVREITAVAVCTDNLGSPCGACRQVLVEFAGDIPVYLSDHFGPEHLT
jgi:cytidine deaminase